jgi:ferredoxin
MPTITIDNTSVTIPQGATILDAARTIGLDIPALCHRDGCTPNTSCLCCVVRVNGAKRLAPSCATVAGDGMVVESETSEIHAARKMALELLLADHAGDCKAPCQTTCPARMDIPTMIEQIHAGRMREAIITIKNHIALPAALGRICPELCEKGCRRGQVDSSVSICRLKRYAADVDLASDAPYLPECRPDSSKRVAIVGSGPAGLAAAWYLRQLGHAAVLFDQYDQPGGNLRTMIDRAKLPEDVLDAEIELIRKLGATFEMNRRIGHDMSVNELRDEYDAVLLAVGEIDAARAAALGVAMAGKGLKADKKTMQTATPGVFATGAAITPYRHAVRAVGDGRSAALMIDRFLHHQLPAEESSFNVRLGVLSEGEVAAFMTGIPTDARAQVAGHDGLSDSQAHTESSRCLHCDCAKLHDCRLRKYSAAYDASTSAYKMPRRPFERVESHPAVVYEPGKCISCGLCVQIAGRSRDRLGLSFIGRGFSVRVAAPFNADLEDALMEVARECAEACPTAALSMRVRLQ